MKIAVLASGLFGSISGSAVANVVGTGVITIPMIKRMANRSNWRLVGFSRMSRLFRQPSIANHARLVRGFWTAGPNPVRPI